MHRSPNLPKSQVPVWERRKNPDRKRWNGKRKDDPRLALERTVGIPFRRVVLHAVAGILLGLGLILLTPR